MKTEISNSVKTNIENEPEDLQKELTKYIELTLPESGALQDHFKEVTRNNMDNYIQEDDTSTLKTFCENVYKIFSSNHIPNVTNSSTSDSSHSRPSRFPAVEKYQKENNGFNSNQEDDDDNDNEHWKEDYQNPDNEKNESLEYNLHLDSHTQKNLAQLRERYLTNKFPEKGLLQSQQMRDIYLEVQHQWSYYGLPFTMYDDLKARKSMIPIDFPTNQRKAIGVISSVLMSYLQFNIPKENEILNDIFSPYKPKMDGYGVLYALV